MSYCSHCGSTNVKLFYSSNGGVIWVAEDMGCSIECYDPEIEMYRCDDCKEITYKSVG